MFRLMFRCQVEEPTSMVSSGLDMAGGAAAGGGLAFMMCALAEARSPVLPKGDRDFKVF